MNVIQSFSLELLLPVITMYYYRSSSNLSGRGTEVFIVKFISIEAVVIYDGLGPGCVLSPYPDTEPIDIKCIVGIYISIHTGKDELVHSLTVNCTLTLVLCFCSRHYEPFVSL